MKIIHTSDWHLGHQLYNYDREEEQRYMLQQIEQLVRVEQPDALLVSGDVYHTSQPSAVVQKMFTDAIVRMHDACPAMYIIVTAGNHDSGAKHEIFRTPWEALHVFMLGHLDRLDPSQHIINIKDKGSVVAMPFVSNRNLPVGFYQQLVTLAAQQTGGQLPVVLMAHATVVGVDWTGHEGASEATVGGIDALPLEVFGTDYDYMALGHIHHAQWVRGGNGRVRYSGTPLPVSFEETFRHTVSVVEIAAKGEKPSLREVELDILRPLVTLPLNGSLTWNEAKDALQGFRPERKDTYLRLAVKVEDFLPPTANAEAQALAQNCGCRFCYILTTRTERERTEQRSLTVDELQREQPADIARRYAEDQNVAWDEDMAAMFAEIETMVAEDTRNE